MNEFDYQVMPKSLLVNGDLLIRPVRPNDIEPIRQWRNAQMDVLRQSTLITKEAQQLYFEQFIWPDKLQPEPKQILLAIEHRGQLIGYGGLVHIDWVYRRAEISFLMKPSYEDNKSVLRDIFFRYLALIQELAFDHLNLNRLSTETYENRVTHIEMLEASGHRLEGVLRDHVIVKGKLTNALVHAILGHEWRSRNNPQILKSDRRNILVTSASRKVPLLRALRDACQRQPCNICIIAGDLDSMAPAKIYADSFWQMPKLSDSELNELVAECISRAISVVLPTRDGELEFWARHREVFLKAGIEVIVSSPVAIARCLDKLEFARFGADAGLPFIPAAESPDPFDGKQLVVKERFGSGSLGIGLRLDRETALQHSTNLVNPIYQPFVSGPEISIDGWADKSGRVAGVVLRRRDLVLAGESQITSTFRNAVLEEQAMEILSKLQLRGPVVLQAIIVNDSLQIIECNPRFGGASTAAIAVGLDSLYWSLNEILLNDSVPTFERALREIRQIRIPTDLIVHDSDF